MSCHGEKEKQDFCFALMAERASDVLLPSSHFATEAVVALAMAKEVYQAPDPLSVALLSPH